jgi:hypothetical protein
MQYKLTLVQILFCIDFSLRCITLFVYRISDILFFFCCISHHTLQVLIKLPELPSGFKFDPIDSELLRHLHEKCDLTNVSIVLINEFIPTIEQPVGILYGSIFTRNKKCVQLSPNIAPTRVCHRMCVCWTSGNLI